MNERVSNARARKTANGAAPDAEKVTKIVTSQDAALGLQPEPDEWEQENRFDAVIKEVRAVLGELDEAPEIQVWRKLATRNKEFCDSYPVSNFEDQNALLKRVRAEWGAGRYYMYLRVAGEVRLNRDVLVADDPQASVRKSGQIGEDVIARLEQGQQALAAQIAQGMQAMATALAGAAKPAPGPDLMGMLTMMGKMREVFAPPPAPSVIDQLGQLNGIFDMAKKVRETVDPSPTPEDPFSAMAPKALDLIGGFLANQQQAAAVQLPQAAVPASLAGNGPREPIAPAGMSTREAEGAPMGAGESTEQREIRMAIEQVNLMARFGTSPENAAEMIWEKAPEDLVDLLRDPAWFERLSVAVPSMSPYKDWYLKTAAQVLRIEAEEVANDAAEQEQEQGPAAGGGAGPAESPAA